MGVCWMQYLVDRAKDRGSVKVTSKAKKSKAADAQVITEEQLEAIKAKYADLGTVLEEQSGTKAFTKHLQTEFSTENIVFWTEMQYWTTSIANPSTKFMTTDFINQAKQHYLSYIDEMAEMQVNIPDTMRAKIQETLFPTTKISGSGSLRTSEKLKIARQSSRAHIARQRSSVRTMTRNSQKYSRGTRVTPEASSPTPVVDFNQEDKAEEQSSIPWNIFEDAEREVFLLMSRDSFARFRKQQLYQDFIEEIAKKKETE